MTSPSAKLLPGVWTVAGCLRLIRRSPVIQGQNALGSPHPLEARNPPAMIELVLLLLLLLVLRLLLLFVSPETSLASLPNSSPTLSPPSRWHIPMGYVTY